MVAEMKAEERVALITGANTGIGLSLVKRLFESTEYNALVLTAVLACRNLDKAKAAREEVLAEFPEAIVEIIQCDTSRPESMTAAAKLVLGKYGRLDWLYLNAGIMPVEKWGISWDVFMTTDIKHILHVLSTSDGLLKQEDWRAGDMQAVFATNVFGHYLLAMLLKDLLVKSQGRIIWTSSNAANTKSFKHEDIEHKNGSDPYGSSKYAVDLLNAALNRELNSKGVYSYTCCPGLVITNVTLGILPWWMWTYILFPFLLIYRCIEPMYVLHPYNGAEALIYLSGLDLPRTPGVLIDTKARGKSSPYERPSVITQVEDEGDLPSEISGPHKDLVYMDPFSKYYSRTSFWGERYVMCKPYPGTEADGTRLVVELEKMAKQRKVL
ncbi:hypothetical protein SARC_05170 [Sphaeroforma arctica JP610]|uniref:3-keto-steroid reductase n=1 Tax=Sphaeroforma arctica JP610 TaxID=667725 RepID=A0A0L0G2X2_9EUKA|nr:hypothetical protein SARC_05170 [Sphaeroforma arctica JP610]KNC82543.1 hypothetical protein SARC_05170 [Sphaeroforma arctica JP610]|eukprot:XP_014156445.1 hypothetical protein SARC_05170 [Sphaeroforma arctica JP610]